MEGNQFFNTGLKLRKLRILHDYEQKQLASILNISQSYYAKIESFNPAKHLSYIPLLAELYKINTCYLIEVCSLDHCLNDSIEFVRQYQNLMDLSN